MHPVLFELPVLGWPLRSFGVTVAAGILLGIWVWGKLLERHGNDRVKDPIRSSQVALWIVVGILVGARLMYVAVEVSRYMASGEVPSVGHDFVDDPFKVFLIWQGGLVMYGGLIGGILFGVISARNQELPVWNALDTAMVGAFIGLAIGRWGCLLVGDDHGSVVPESYVAAPMVPMGEAEVEDELVQALRLPVSEWNRGVKVPGFLVKHGLKELERPYTAEKIMQGLGFTDHESPMDRGAVGPFTIRVPEERWLALNDESLFSSNIAGKTLWATQAWMSVNAVLVALVGYLVIKRRKWCGQASAVMLAHYAVTRFTIEFFRGDEIRGLWFGGALSTSQLVSIAGLGIAVAIFVKRPGPVPPTPKTA